MDLNTLLDGLPSMDLDMFLQTTRARVSQVMSDCHRLKHSSEVLEVDMRSINDLETAIVRLNESIESNQANDEEKNILREKKRVFEEQLDIKRREVESRASQIASFCATFEESCCLGISRL